MLLYSTGKDLSKEKWDGLFTRFWNVLGLFGADEVRPLGNFADDLHAFAMHTKNVYVDAPSSHHCAGTMRGLLRYLSRQQLCAARSDPDAYLNAIATSKCRPLALLVGALQSVKSIHEVEILKVSVDISVCVHAKVGRASPLHESGC